MYPSHFLISDRYHQNGGTSRSCSVWYHQYGGTGAVLGGRYNQYGCIGTTNMVVPACVFMPVPPIWWYRRAVGNDSISKMMSGTNICSRVLYVFSGIFPGGDASGGGFGSDRIAGERRSRLCIRSAKLTVPVCLQPFSVKHLLHATAP